MWIADQYRFGEMIAVGLRKVSRNHQMVLISRLQNRIVNAYNSKHINI